MRSVWPTGLFPSRPARTAGPVTTGVHQHGAGQQGQAIGRPAAEAQLHPAMLDLALHGVDVVFVVDEVGLADLEQARDQPPTLVQMPSQAGVDLAGTDGRQRFVAVGGAFRGDAAFLQPARVARMEHPLWRQVGRQGAVEQQGRIPGMCHRQARKTDLLAVVGLLHADADFAHLAPAPFIGHARRPLADVVAGTFAKGERCRCRAGDRLAQDMPTEVERRR